MNFKLEPAKWSRGTDQWIPCFDRCQLTITWMSNIKNVPNARVAPQSFALAYMAYAHLISLHFPFPFLYIYLFTFVHLFHGGVDVRTVVRSQNQIPRTDGLSYFLSNGGTRNSPISNRYLKILVTSLSRPVIDNKMTGRSVYVPSVCHCK